MFIEKSELAAKLKSLKGILNNKLEGIGGILLKDGYIYAMNYEIAIKGFIDSAAPDESFVIPRPAIDLIENLPGGTIEIKGNEKSISIRCGEIKNRYQTTDPNSYPMIETALNGTNSADVPSKGLFETMNSVLYAVSETASKAQMRGVLLDACDGYLNIVGCDGTKLAWNKIKYDGEFKVIIPKATVKQLISLGMSGDISFSWDENGIVLKNDEFEVYSKVLSGEFLNYKALFIEYPNQTIIDRRKFSDCLRRANICADDRALSAVMCSFEDEKVAVSLKKSSAEYEEAVQLEIPVKEPVKIGFNGRYLLDALNSFDAEKVSVKVGTPHQGAIIDDGDMFALVLPVQM